MGKTKRSSRSPQRRSADWRLVTFWIVLLALLGWSGHFLLTNSRFYIRQVRIDGVQTLNIQRIAVAAQTPKRTNIFLFWLEKRKSYCTGVQACDPVIESDSLGIELPNSLRLRITERQPYTVLNLPNSLSFLMDSHRVPYRKIALNQAQVPIVTIPETSETVVEGSALPSDIDKHVSAAYNLLSLLDDRQIGPLSDVEGVTVDQYDNVNLRLHNQLVIKLGQETGLPDRLTEVETALTADPSLESKAEYLDFTTPRPAIMEKPSPPATLRSAAATTAAATIPLSADIGQ